MRANSPPGTASGLPPHPGLPPRSPHPPDAEPASPVDLPVPAGQPLPARQPAQVRQSPRTLHGDLAAAATATAAAMAALTKKVVTRAIQFRSVTGRTARADGRAARTHDPAGDVHDLTWLGPVCVVGTLATAGILGVVLLLSLFTVPATSSPSGQPHPAPAPQGQYSGPPAVLPAADVAAQGAVTDVLAAAQAAYDASGLGATYLDLTPQDVEHQLVVGDRPLRFLVSAHWPSVNDRVVSLGTEDDDAVVATLSATGTCWFGLVIDYLFSPTIATYHVPGTGSYVNASTGGLCEAVNAPTSGWSSTWSGLDR